MKAKQKGENSICFFRAVFIVITLRAISRRLELSFPPSGTASAFSSVETRGTVRFYPVRAHGSGHRFHQTAQRAALPERARRFGAEERPDVRRAAAPPMARGHRRGGVVFSPHTPIARAGRISVEIVPRPSASARCSAGVPLFFIFRQPGAYLTRHVVAAGQMLFSALLIHLSGGRTEMHFHIFGSLAFLAFYRDWRVLVTASAVVVLDHFLRGMYLAALHLRPWRAGQRPWRWVEHVLWVVFEDIFLIFACIHGNEACTPSPRRRPNWKTPAPAWNAPSANAPLSSPRPTATSPPEQRAPTHRAGTARRAE